MKELFINKAKAVSFSGHRKLSKEFNLKSLKDVINDCVFDGYDTFLIGMALGFDTECFREVYKLKGKYDIKIIACVPCKSQAYKFNDEQKKEYDEMLKKADETVYLSEEYTNTCMKKRNEYMVDNSSLLVCYLRQTKGGTFNTFNYAKKKNIKIINL